jgi:hypothetical protein
MDPTEVLVGVAEIAVAFTGFSGVVIVFGRRAEGTWLPEDRFRLSLLLETSLLTAGWALLALVFWHAPGIRDSAWTLSSLLWSIYGIGTVLNSIRRNSRLRREYPDLRERVSPRLFNVFVLMLIPTFILLQIANVIFWQEFLPFLAALVFSLAASGVQFTRLIYASFR